MAVEYLQIKQWFGALLIKLMQTIGVRMHVTNAVFNDLCY